MTGAKAKVAIGLMSGTSMDGIDVASVTTDGERLIERGPAREYPYSLAQVKALEEAVEMGRAAEDAGALRSALVSLDRSLTQWHADAVDQFEAEHGVRADVVGFHGHTVAHRPQAGWTLQLGNGAALAARVGRPVVHDFRQADMAAGGEGAPLVPVYHEGLAGALFVPGIDCIAFLNVGGVANATVLRPGMAPEAFDCGPGNMLVDRWMQREAALPYDAGGRIASEGGIDREWVAEEMTRPFFARSGPRSLDRLDFDLPAPGRFDLADGARTLARLTAEAAAAALAHDAPDLVLVCGGGRLNDTLMRDLDELLAGRVELAEQRGFDGGAMEAEAFAYLAVRSLRGLPLTFPTTTGCDRPVSGGMSVGP